MRRLLTARIRAMHDRAERGLLTAGDRRLLARMRFAFIDHGRPTTGDRAHYLRTVVAIERADCLAALADGRMTSARRLERAAAWAGLPATAGRPLLLRARIAWHDGGRLADDPLRGPAEALVKFERVRSVIQHQTPRAAIARRVKEQTEKARLEHGLAEATVAA